MYFLNGGRIYIKPAGQYKLIEQQLANCLKQLVNFARQKKIYKLNFFADPETSDAYFLLKQKIEEQVAGKFQAPVLCSLISQPPISHHMLVEVFYFDENLWKQECLLTDKGSAIVFRKEGAKVLFGQVQAHTAVGCAENAGIAFREMLNILSKSGFPLNAVVKQWNYLENILGFDTNKQRYQEFNNVRSEFYGRHFETAGYPAATGIGTKHGGIIMEVIAVNAPEAVSLPLNNPEQVAAHGYSSRVLAGENHQPKSTPKFERARYLKLFGKKQLFISGTASIRGEKTEGAGNPAKQTRIAIENIQKLYTGKIVNEIAGSSVQPVYGHARVYLKNRKDFPLIKRTFEDFYENLPVVYLIADICREDLLVEIEGNVILV